MIIMILSVWGNKHGRLEGLEMKNGEENLKSMSVGTWGTTPLIDP